MISLNYIERRDRLTSALGVAAFHALLAYAFITGLASEFRVEEPEKLQMFDIAEQLPPPRNEPPPPSGPLTKKEKTPDPEGAASPPNLEDTPTQIMVPVPKMQLEVPPPIAAAPIAAEGNAPAAGAALEPGLGTGRGGTGEGTGSGASGTGTGGGARGGRAAGDGSAQAKWLRGRFQDPDYPRTARAAKQEGITSVRLVVDWNGRVARCTVTKPSGVRALDVATCSVMKERFVFRPARNNRGRPVRDVVDWEHHWMIRDVAALRGKGQMVEAMDEAADTPAEGVWKRNLVRVDVSGVLHRLDLDLTNVALRKNIVWTFPPGAASACAKANAEIAFMQRIVVQNPHLFEKISCKAKSVTDSLKKAAKEQAVPKAKAR